MKSYVFALAALAALGFTGAAFAGEATPVAKGPVAMSDSELDAVTAGDFVVITQPCPLCEAPPPPTRIQETGGSPPPGKEQSPVVNFAVAG